MIVRTPERRQHRASIRVRKKILCNFLLWFFFSNGSSAVITDDNGPTRFVNGEINDTDHSDSVFVGRSNSTSAVASAMSTSTGSNNNRSNNNRPKSFHRHHSKNQLRKYSIPLNVERYGSTEDNNILSDSSCVSETPMMMRSIENDYPTAMRSFFGKVCVFFML